MKATEITAGDEAAVGGTEAANEIAGKVVKGNCWYGDCW